MSIGTILSALLYSDPYVCCGKLPSSDSSVDITTISLFHIFAMHDISSSPAQAQDGALSCTPCSFSSTPYVIASIASSSDSCCEYPLTLDQLSLIQSASCALTLCHWFCDPNCCSASVAYAQCPSGSMSIFTFLYCVYPDVLLVFGCGVSSWVLLFSFLGVLSSSSCFSSLFASALPSYPSSDDSSSSSSCWHGAQSHAHIILTLPSYSLMQTFSHALHRYFPFSAFAQHLPFAFGHRHS